MLSKPPDYTVLKGLPFRVGECVEVVLLEEQGDSSMNDLVTDISEKEWLQSVATNPVFDFLTDADEDIYPSYRAAKSGAPDAAYPLKL
jgi:hypothetical protein